MKQPIIQDKIHAPLLKNTHLGAFSKKSSDAFFEGRIFSDFAKNVVYQEAEDAFKNKLDDETIVGIWQGEFWGKWILSAVEVAKYSQDEELKAFLHRAALKLLTYAREDGYLNTYRNSLNVFRLPDRKIAVPVIGFECDWNWNIWCRKYTLWGLLAVYELTDDKKVLDGATRLADHLIDELKANGIALVDTGTFVGLPSCSILKPMLTLYRHTENKKYLDFCIHEIADNWEREDGRCPNLITNGISGKRLTDWYPNSPSWAKAYEMMSCYEGLCELYRYTANERYLKASEGVYEILKKYELNPVFSVAYNDVFADASDEINAISEPCDAIHWMRLCYELFTLTGDAKYIDSFELAYYNAFLTGIFKEGTWGARGVRGAGCHMWASMQAKMQHQHCCVNNMPRAFMRTAETAIMQSADTLFINLYEPFSAHFDHADVTIHDGYFERGKVNIDIKFIGAPTKIAFRIPAWCESADVTVNGYTQKAASGYFTVESDAQNVAVEIDFHTQAKLHAFEKAINPHDQLINGKPDWKLARWLIAGSESETKEDLFLREARCTLTYGPLLLARSKHIDSSDEEMFGSSPLDASFDCTLTYTPDERVGYAYKARFTKGDQVIETRVCNYASAANDLLKNEGRFFSIYF